MNIGNWSLCKRVIVAVIVVLAIGIAGFFGVMKLGVFVDDSTNAAQPAIVVVTTTDLKAEEERVYTQQWVGDKLPAYACNGKTEVAQFSKLTDLTFCPDYTVTIELKGRKASDVPVVQQAANSMITVTPVHYGEWANKSDTLGKTVWNEGWYFEIVYDPSVISAGMNEKYNYTYLNNGNETSWTGPEGYNSAIGQVNPSGALVTRESFSDYTVVVEIYAVSKDLAVVGLPIDPEKDPK
ncbi:MAG TPA: hypothetical protein VM581_01165 [Magnetospirillaceae bacterium]|nr:hypothetical protein [Magnetospirillaceae bacterium]